MAFQAFDSHKAFDAKQTNSMTEIYKKIDPLDCLSSYACGAIYAKSTNEKNYVEKSRTLECIPGMPLVEEMRRCKYRQNSTCLVNIWLVKLYTDTCSLCVIFNLFSKGTFAVVHH